MHRRTQEAIIELSSDLVVHELDEAARAMYGLDELQTRGRALRDVLLNDAGVIDWASHWSSVRAGEPFERLMLHRSCSGLRVWVLARLEANGAGARLTVRRASGREVVHELHSGGVIGALKQMMAVGGVGVWLDDRVSDEFDWSRYALALHDLPPDAEVTPALLFAQIHPDDRAQVAAEIQRGIAEHVPYDGVIRVKRGERDYRHVRVFGGTSYDAQGVPLLSVGGVVDVSENTALRARIHELQEQLQAAQRGDVVGRLAGGVAHDFNNILTGILGCCEMLSLEALPAEQLEDIQQIRSATLRAADLTRQLLAFGRRQALRRRVIAPATLLRDVLGLLRRTVPANIELSLECDPAVGCVVADDTQLHQVLTNLVVNGAQAMPRGGRIAISAAPSVITRQEGNERAGKYVRFVVEDSGPGVPREIRSRIFEPFFSTKPPGQGSGLGLSVVQGIVEQHLGHIVLADGAAGGARFEVFLPATEQAADVPSAQQPARPAPREAALRVLLVEDEKMVRELTKRILVGNGFTVMEAPDATVALQRASEGEFDVLLTDVVLPGLSGAELVVRLRELGRAFRVVYMSGYPADFVDSRVQLEPSDILVQKPFTAAALVAALRSGVAPRDARK